jgi:hypothetical protein
MRGAPKCVLSGGHCGDRTRGAVHWDALRGLPRLQVAAEDHHRSERFPDVVGQALRRKDRRHQQGKRGPYWARMELKVAELAVDELFSEKAVIVDIREENGIYKKSGLIIEGIEFRPYN